MYMHMYWIPSLWPRTHWLNHPSFSWRHWRGSLHVHVRVIQGKVHEYGNNCLRCLFVKQKEMYMYVHVLRVVFWSPAKGDRYTQVVFRSVAALFPKTTKKSVIIPLAKSYDRYRFVWRYETLRRALFTGVGIFCCICTWAWCRYLYFCSGSDRRGAPRSTNETLSCRYRSHYR